MKVGIIVGSTRNGRMGERVGKWVYSKAQKQADWDVTLIDLESYELPMYDDAKLPVMMGGVYENAAVTKWSEVIAAQDAFVILTPEYNHGMPAPLKNALDWLAREWANKALGIVSYSGVSTGGVRAAEQLRLITAWLGMASVQVAVAIGGVGQTVSEAGVVEAEALQQTLTKELGQVNDWGKALKGVREEAVAVA